MRNLKQCVCTNYIYKLVNLCFDDEIDWRHTYENLSNGSRYELETKLKGMRKNKNCCHLIPHCEYRIKKLILTTPGMTHRGFHISISHFSSFFFSLPTNLPNLPNYSPRRNRQHTNSSNFSCVHESTFNNRNTPALKLSSRWQRIIYHQKINPRNWKQPER